MVVQRLGFSAPSAMAWVRFPARNQPKKKCDKVTLFPMHAHVYL